MHLLAGRLLHSECMAHGCGIWESCIAWARVQRNAMASQVTRLGVGPDGGFSSLSPLSVGTRAGGRTRKRRGLKKKICPQTWALVMPIGR